MKHSEFDSFFKPKGAENNRLSREALALFKSKHLSDLSLEVHDVDDSDAGVVRVPTHACIVASRCVWFERALASGMRESIDRRVRLHDRNVSTGLFSRHFVEYLYSGRLDDHGLGNDELVELLTIADKYEVFSLL